MQQESMQQESIQLKAALQNEGTPTPTLRPSRGIPGWDLLAAALTSVCLFHCLALPLLLSLLPLTNQYTENPTIHLLLVLAAVPLALWAVRQSLRARQDYLFIIVALLGLSLLLGAVLVESLESMEEPLTLVGGVALAGAHIGRWRAHRQRIRPV